MAELISVEKLKDAAARANQALVHAATSADSGQPSCVALLTLLRACLPQPSAEDIAVEDSRQRLETWLQQRLLEADVPALAAMYADIKRNNARARWIAAEASKSAQQVSQLFQILLLTAQHDPRFETIPFGINHRPADLATFLTADEKWQGALPLLVPLHNALALCPDYFVEDEQAGYVYYSTAWPAARQQIEEMLSMAATVERFASGKARRATAPAAAPAASDATPDVEAAPSAPAAAPALERQSTVARLAAMVGWEEALHGVNSLASRSGRGLNWDALRDDVRHTAPRTRD